MAPANWCPSCQTVLANEQVLPDGTCERCHTPVTRRSLAQWFFRITRYADDLLDFSDIEWPERIVTMQRNWIGRSEGTMIAFGLESPEVDNNKISVFTTRPDTIYGVTFMVMAPEHPLVPHITTPEQRAEVNEYVEQSRRATEIERLSTEREKTGVFTGAYCTNLLNGEKVPILLADYVLANVRLGHRHGRAGARRARLRVRAEVRHSDPRRHRAARTGTASRCRRRTSSRA